VVSAVWTQCQSVTEGQTDITANDITLCIDLYTTRSRDYWLKQKLRRPQIV